MAVALLSTLYLLSGLVANLAYIPTIVDVWKLKPSANIGTYVMWSLSSAICATYATFVNGDTIFVVLSGTGFLSCGIVLLLELRRQRLSKMLGL